MSGGSYYNYFRSYDPSIGRYTQSDPIGLQGGLNTYSYVGGNPIAGTDPLGLYCILSSGRWGCQVPGGSSFNVPAPQGATSIGPGYDHYHEYNVSEPLGDADPQCVLEELRRNPTPPYFATPNRATSGGTQNNAPVLPGQTNTVTSYVNGNVVVNTAGANDGSAFGPGYVARYIQDGRVHTAGEGLDPLQSDEYRPVEIVNDFFNDQVWGRQLREIIEKCSCQ